MILCITEKPSVAKDIASILGADIRRDGYYEGLGDCQYKVTWTFGHLCTLKTPDDYTPLWKRWTLGTLPMIPERFGIKLIQQKSIEHQFDVIQTLISQASKVINCGDAGQEGELIQRWVMQKAGIKCPVERLWISSLTDESIRKGFESLKPSSDFDNLYYAGMSRAIGDWLLGMNATRLYSLKYSEPGKVLSVGRVQTPTLALIVQRHFEITNFKPEDYWELRTKYRDVVFNAQLKKIKSEADAQAIIDRIASLPFSVIDVTEKKGREAPPRLFDLTSLQVECNKRFGWSADESLRLIQSLYEKKVTTYPRVDTTYLSEDIYPKVPQILRDMTPYASYTAPILAANKIPKSKKVFDNSKVTDHHAIIPTGQSPTVLVGNERKMYHLIAMRFIAAFYPDCLFTTTTVTGKADDVTFKVTGKVINEPGWRVLFANDSQQSEKNQDGDDRILPAFVVGESGPHAPFSVKKTTQPPKFYTEGTLLRAMETAGKTVDDETLREAMKENGIGRPSTRAAIIEILFKRGYIYRERKNIMASQAGIDLIATIHEELLKSAALTGIWENKLRKIERGQYSASEFITELKQMITQIVLTVKADNSLRHITIDQSLNQPKTKEKTNKSAKTTDDSPKPRAKRKPSVTDLNQIICPKCGQGHLLKGRAAYGCSRYAEGCDMRLDFATYGAETKPADLYKRLVKDGIIKK